MEFQAYTCPQCGAQLNIDSVDTHITVCPKCGSSIHITYKTNENQSNLKDFVTADGVRIASAYVPDSYKLNATITNQWQSEMIPFTTRVSANNADEIIMFADSKELFHDVKNVFIKGIIALVPNHTSNGYKAFEEPEDYVKEYAERISGAALNLVAKTDLPSYFGKNPKDALTQLNNDVSAFDAFMEIPSAPVNQLCESVLYKFEGKTKSGVDCVVFAGVDYEGQELIYGFDLFKGLNLDKLKENLNKLVGSTPSLQNLGSTVSDVISGKDKLTFDDMMHGGLLGKAMRKNKEKETMKVQEPVKQQPQVNEESPKFGHSGRRVDQITFGAYRKYLCVALKEREKEAERDFINFVSTYTPDQDLSRRSADLINQKMAQIRQAVAMNQQIVMQKQAQLHQMQMETSRKISEYSRSASAGLMDSWKLKMDSDARMSKARSEATLGVNTYTNSYGQNVQVSVGADHVYENQYGDVYGVSGSALDQSTLNDLNWKKIDDK